MASISALSAARDAMNGRVTVGVAVSAAAHEYRHSWLGTLCMPWGQMEPPSGRAGGGNSSGSSWCVPSFWQSRSWQARSAG